MGIPHQVMSKAQVQDSKGPLEWEDPVRTKRLGVLGDWARTKTDEFSISLWNYIYIHRMSYNH